MQNINLFMLFEFNYCRNKYQKTTRSRNWGSVRIMRKVNICLPVLSVSAGKPESAPENEQMV